MNRVINLTALATLLLLVTSLTVLSQGKPSLRIDSIEPFDKAVPGQIMGLNVEGIGAGPAPVMLDAADFKIEVSQDGVTQEAKARTVTPTMIVTRPQGTESNEQGEPQRKFYQKVTFAVPRGLHLGAAELKIYYRNQGSTPVTLNIVDKPMMPVIGTMSVLTMGGMVPDRAPGTKPIGNDLGWKLERGATVRPAIEPLVDPEDPGSAILVRFKQGGAYYDAVTRVVNQPFKVENRSSSVRFLPARDELEVEVPAALAMGQAEVEIRLKANGQTSDPVTMAVTITDSARTVEAAGEHAPRLMAVMPKRTGAGQSILLSIDQLRGLEPEPDKTIVFIEQGGARYAARVERNSAVFRPDTQPDEPVALIVRTSRQIVGKAQVRIFNPLRSEPAGSSEPVAIEILEKVLPPEVLGIHESTDSDLAPLRRMYEIQRQAGRQFHEYDPSRRYLTIRATGIDYNPHFVRVTLEQAARSYTLSFADFSSSSGDSLIVRLPKELKSGTVRFTIENLGVDASSTPVVKEFKLK